MEKIKVIVTAVGCPGASTLIKKLKNNGEREIEIIGTDMDKEVVGRFLCDKFYTVSSGKSDEFIEELLQIANKESVDAILSESSNEVHNLALNKHKFEDIGVKVLVSDPEAIELANNKYKMYEVLRKNTDLDLPKYYYPKNLDEFVEYAYKLGYPEQPICFKPHIGKGSRGFRIIDSRVSRKDLLMNYKPNSRYMGLEEFKEIFKDEPDFPDLLLMEFVEGNEITADSICYKGNELFTTVKSVEEARWGVIVRGELLDRPDILEQTKTILKHIKLSYNVNIQFVGDKLIEINPRVSTFIYQENLIQPYLSIKYVLGELDKKELNEYKNEIDYGLRMIRYMDQVFWKQ